MRPTVFCSALGATLLLLSASCASAQKDSGLQLLLGNPSGATANAEKRENYLFMRQQYALGYNDTWGFPRWASWHLAKEDIGDTARGEFVPDPDLPSGFTRITTRDYSGSGYDRGHNVPSKDRSATRADNDIAFYMTNITPQAAGMNQGPWERLESYCRDLTEKGNELYIVCGHGFNEAPSRAKRIGGKISVPSYGWKVIVVLPERGGDDRKRITASTRVIAVRMPNISTIRNHVWTDYRTTPGEIEKATGLTFFGNLPLPVAQALRKKKDSVVLGGEGDTARPSRPDASPDRTKPDARGSGKVWVNLNSGVYWRPGTEYYGKTKKGKYMTEAEAKAAGYHAPGE